MQQKKTISILVLIIAVIAAGAASIGIFSSGGPGTYIYETIRGEAIEIYGKGLYQHMSADVAIQGIAQDYVTLFLGIPLLLLTLWGARRGLVRSRLLLTGTLGYFFVTYLFYTVMAMYNALFLAYIVLLGASFFALIINLITFDSSRLKAAFSKKTPTRFVAGFLIFNTIAIALLWLSMIVPPLLDGSIYPAAVEHYTTLIVQGLDLGLLLPMGFVSAFLLLKKKAPGYLFTAVYVIFLALLMTALMAKIVAMAQQGVNVVPAVFIIPVFNATAILCTFLVLKNVNEKTYARVTV